MSLRYVVAIVRSDILEALERRLASSGVHGLTVTKVKGIGEHANFFSRDWLTDHAKVEIFTEEARVEVITSAIMDTAYTGDRGDGIVTVIPVEKFYRIRTRFEALPDHS